jgi:hypothetical protein
LEYGGTLTKLLMHASSRNMFPTTRNQIIEMQIEHTRLSFLDRQSSDQNFIHEHLLQIKFAKKFAELK